MTNNVPDITMADQQAILNRSASETARGARCDNRDDIVRSTSKDVVNMNAFAYGRTGPSKPEIRLNITPSIRRKLDPFSCKAKSKSSYMQEQPTIQEYLQSIVGKNSLEANPQGSCLIAAPQRLHAGPSSNGGDDIVRPSVKAEANNTWGVLRGGRVCTTDHSRELRNPGDW